MTSKITIYLIVLFAAGSMSACTSLPSRLHDTGVRIEPVLNDGAEVRSAGFWTNDEGIMLRGQVVANTLDDQPCGHYGARRLEHRVHRRGILGGPTNTGEHLQPTIRSSAA